MKIFTLQVLFLNYYSYLCTRNSKFLSPDGGIGRRAGLKHQWSNPSRFEPESGYFYYIMIIAKAL